MSLRESESGLGLGLGLGLLGHRLAASPAGQLTKPLTARDRVPTAEVDCRVILSRALTTSITGLNRL